MRVYCVGQSVPIAVLWNGKGFSLARQQVNRDFVKNAKKKREAGKRPPVENSQYYEQDV